MFNLVKAKNENRTRLTNLLNRVEKRESPLGWKVSASIAIGGLTEVGFSKVTHQLLVISSSGRSVIDCATGEKLARDYEEYGDWYDSLSLTCQGIGPLEGELVTIAGMCGGGLPTNNRYGESLQRAATEWPVEDIFFCPPGKSALIEGYQEGCCRFISDHIRCVGFSWHGEFIISATSSDITIWQRLSTVAHD
ncbi:hypothetical protein C9426_10085 [Serratia sp. S1B]|nr:hypothetical protein C9426_10085 [Serratia sp. S1B]